MVFVKAQLVGSLALRVKFHLFCQTLKVWVECLKIIVKTNWQLTPSTKNDTSRDPMRIKSELASMIMSVTLVRHDKVYPLNEIKTKTKTWCADIRHRVNIYSQSKSPCVIKKIESIKFLSATLTKSYTLYRTKYRATKGLGASPLSLVWQLVTAVHTHTHM